jgi:type II secretion system protein H
VAPRCRQALRGFTLIEIMAVVLIIGLTMSLVLPNMAATQNSQLKRQAREIVLRLELAREQAILKGTPHRVLIDLEAGTYRVDWYVNEDRAMGVTNKEIAQRKRAAVKQFDLEGDIPLFPPRGDQRDYYPVNNRFGRNEWLSDDYFFVGADTPDGWIDRGRIMVVFERDGTSDFVEIVLSDTHDQRVILQVQPLNSAVRIYDDES